MQANLTECYAVHMQDETCQHSGVGAPMMPVNMQSTTTAQTSAHGCKTGNMTTETRDEEI